MASKSKKEAFLEGLSNSRDLSYLMDADISPTGSEDAKASETVVPINSLVDFHDHPFRVEEETPEFEELVESIKESGLIYPLLVRPVDDKYEIISGHRRLAACRKAGLTEVSVIIRPLNDYEATVLMVQSNLYRAEIRASERAKAYRMCHDLAERYQKGHDVALELGEGSSESRRTVYRYIRLSYLIEPLMNRVDDKTLTIRAGEDLSYLNADSQERLNAVMEQNEIKTITPEQANMLHDAYKDNGEDLSLETIFSLLIKPKNDQPKAKSSVSIKKKELESYFGEDVDVDYATSIIHLLLFKYKEGLLDDYITEAEIREAQELEENE